jgi:hypothetical protein
VAEGAEGFPRVPRLRVSAMQVSVVLRRSEVQRTEGIERRRFGLLILAALAFFLYGLWAAISVFQGKDFRYIVIGRWLERYLSQDAGAKEAET